MNTTRKVMIGVGLASGVLLAAWLLTGTRKQKTKKFIATKAKTITKRLTSEKKNEVFEDSDVHYV